MMDKRKPGRPRVNDAEKTQPYTISLTPSEMEAIRKMGDGNLTAGIRKAIEMTTQAIERINLDDNTDVDWQGAGHYAAYIGKERYIWKRDDDPNNEPVYVTNWKQLIGKEYTTPKRY